MRRHRQLIRVVVSGRVCFHNHLWAHAILRMGLWQISPRKCTLGNMECCFLSLSFKMILLPFLHTGFTLVWILMTFVSTFQSLSFDVLSLLLFSLNSFQETKKKVKRAYHMEFCKTLPGCTYTFIFVFFCEDFWFCWKVLSISARRGNISPSAATIVFCFFFKHTQTLWS